MKAGNFQRRNYFDFLLDFKVIADVGERHYVRADWLNDAAKISTPDVRNLSTKLKPLFKGNQIAVYRPAVEFILAMKLIAGRPQDLDDSLFLVQQTGIKKRTKPKRAHEPHFPTPASLVFTDLQNHNQLGA